MKTKYLIAILICLNIIISCKAKIPNCIHDAEPSIFPKISGKFIGQMIISGKIVNIGNAKARNVRIIFEFYDYPNAENKIKQLIVYTEPTTLAPGEKGEYETALGNLPGDKSIKEIFSIKDKKIFQEKEKKEIISIKERAPTLGELFQAAQDITVEEDLRKSREEKEPTLGELLKQKQEEEKQKKQKYSSLDEVPLEAVKIEEKPKEEGKKAKTLMDIPLPEDPSALDLLLKVEKEKELKGKLENYKHYCYYTYTIKWD